MPPELEFTLLQKDDPGRVEKEGGGIFRLRGAAGIGGAEPAHALLA